MYLVVSSEFQKNLTAMIASKQCDKQWYFTVFFSWNFNVFIVCLSFNCKFRFCAIVGVMETQLVKNLRKQFKQFNPAWWRQTMQFLQKHVGSSRLSDDTCLSCSHQWIIHVYFVRHITQEEHSAISTSVPIYLTLKQLWLQTCTCVFVCTSWRQMQWEPQNNVCVAFFPIPNIRFRATNTLFGVEHINLQNEADCAQQVVRRMQMRNKLITPARLPCLHFPRLFRTDCMLARLV